MNSFQPTTDRDIRLSASQIIVTQYALRDEVKRRTRSIEKAEAARAAGNTVQHNVLQSHYESRDAAREVLVILEVAAKQIAHRVAAQVKTV